MANAKGTCKICGEQIVTRGSSICGVMLEHIEEEHKKVFKQWKCLDKIKEIAKMQMDNLENSWIDFEFRINKQEQD